MKTTLTFILTTLLTTAALAKSEATYKTLVTCAQADGDQWVEVGITPYTKGAYSLAVVLHNNDDGTAKLQQKIIVVINENTNSTLSFVDSFETAKVVVNKQNKTALFALLQDGPGGIYDERMSCEFESTITWDINAGPQPR